MKNIYYEIYFWVRGAKIDFGCKKYFSTVYFKVYFKVYYEKIKV